MGDAKCLEEMFRNHNISHEVEHNVANISGVVSRFCKKNKKKNNIIFHFLGKRILKFLNLHNWF